MLGTRNSWRAARGLILVPTAVKLHQPVVLMSLRLESPRCSIITCCCSEVLCNFKRKRGSGCPYNHPRNIKNLSRAFSAIKADHLAKG